jgi:hypothetical protein
VLPASKPVPVIVTVAFVAPLARLFGLIEETVELEPVAFAVEDALADADSAP